MHRCSFCSLQYDTEIGLRDHIDSMHATGLEEIKQESKELFDDFCSAQDHRENGKTDVWYYENYCLKDLRVCLERIDMTTITENKELACETVDRENPRGGQQNLEVFVDGFQENCADSSLDGVNCRDEDDVSEFESGPLTIGEDADDLQESEAIPLDRNLSGFGSDPLTGGERVNLQESESIALEREDTDLQEPESDILADATDKVENGISSLIPMEPFYITAVPQSKKHLERLDHNNYLGRFIASHDGENPLRNESLPKTTNRSVKEF